MHWTRQEVRKNLYEKKLLIKYKLLSHKIIALRSNMFIVIVKKVIISYIILNFSKVLPKKLKLIIWNNLESLTNCK
jgi:hypothetical protein